MSVQLKLKKRELEKHTFRGLQMLAHHLLHCSACGAPLVQILHVSTEPPIKSKYRADCPHCGDHSFPTEEIQGSIYVDSTEYTIYDGHRNPTPNESEDTFYLTTTKARNYND